MIINDPRATLHGAGSEFTDARERHLFLLRYAILAPSTMNTQPWLFKATHGHVEIWPDPSRQLRAMDASGREMIISCGAALANAEVAGRHLGFAMEVEKDGHYTREAHCLARLHSPSPKPARELDTLLFKAIRHRHTVRKPFLKRGIASGLVRKIMDVVGSESVTLTVVDEPETRLRLAGAAVERMKKLAENPARQQEANRWRAAWSDERRDGIPQAALSMSPPEYLWLYMFGGRTAVSAQARKKLNARLLECPRMFVLSTPGDTRHDWLEAGYAMERALLRAASIGIQATFIGALINEPEGREQTRHILGLSQTPQLVLGLGHTTTLPLTPRRPVDDVLLKT